MTKFTVEIPNAQDLHDRLYIRVDDRFTVSIIRAERCVKLEVFPITDGEEWVDPCERFSVRESDVEELEKELRA